MRIFQAVDLRSPCCNRKIGTVRVRNHVHSYNKTCSKCFAKYVVITGGEEVRWIPKDMKALEPRQEALVMAQKALPAPKQTIAKKPYALATQKKQKKSWFRW